MKKTILTGVSILALSIGAPAFAQSNNQSDVTQTGSGNSAIVVQDAGDDNTSEVDQNGIEAAANVTQLGSDNRSDIDQNDASTNDTIGVNPGADPEAIVLQNGNDNLSSIEQTGVQQGNFNFLADVNQQTDGNRSAIDQDAIGGQFSGTLRADVDQTAASTSEITQSATGVQSKNLIARVEQDASSSEILQSATAGVAGFVTSQVFQSGGADSFISQNVTGDDAGDMLVRVEQDGASSSNVVQDNAGDDAVMMDTFVTQTGDMNDANVTQTFNNTSSQNFIVDLDQDGFNNRADVTQQDQGAANVNMGVGDNTLLADIDQTGDNGRVILDQFNRVQDANIQQSGNANRTEALQDGIGNELDVFQTGDDGRIFSTQNGGGTGLLNQGGSLNRTDLLQSAESNVYGEVNQDGLSNRASIDQIASARGDNARINQLAALSGSRATIIQTGDTPGTPRSDSLAEITQEAGSNNRSTIEQGGGLLNIANNVQNGTDLTSTILQAGSNNQAYVGQNGIGTTSNVSQTGDGHFASVSQGGAAVPTAPTF